MARKRLNVTFHKPDPARIPDSLVAGALLFADLEARGVVAEVAERLKIRRQGGYPAVDVFLTVLLYLASDVTEGFKAFWLRLRGPVVQLAALAGRRRLPSPASVSRALDAVEPELLREASPWLLVEASGVDKVLRHPSAMTYDAKGQGWHVFDLDPTVTTMRHRALPVGDDLPDAMRRSEETGAPGHSGRKRGDVQYRRVDVQHAGTGVFVHAHLHKGNGDDRVDLDLALGDVVDVVKRLEHPLERSLVRVDGEYGNVPDFTAFRERGVPFLTRLNRPKMYEDADVLAKLRDATWYTVPDSGSGPVRAATDLGVLTVHPGERTKRTDGTDYAPLALRVVASVFPKEGKAQRGRVLDDWQVELFVADIPADAWPAPEVVASYFGRCGQENRFAQEDREVGLDRIVSYHLPGQEFATLVGLFLLNLRIARGFELEPPPAVRPTPTLRVPKVDARLPAGWPRDPIVTTVLQKLDWSSLLATRLGWRWDAKAAELFCPEGRALVLTTVRAKPHSPGRTGIIFCRPYAGCNECSRRPTCLHSPQPDTAKHAEFSVDSVVADVLRGRLALVRHKVAAVPRVELRPIEVAAGLHAVIAPRFLPAAARHRFEAIFLDATLRVEVDLPPPAPPRPRLVAADEADRQQRRLTWTDRNARNALSDDAIVRLDVSGHRDLRLLFDALPDGNMAVGAMK